MVSTRESTWPAWSCAVPGAEAWMRPLCSSWVPAARRAARSDRTRPDRRLPRPGTRRGSGPRWFRSRNWPAAPARPGRGARPSPHLRRSRWRQARRRLVTAAAAGGRGPPRGPPARCTSPDHSRWPGRGPAGPPPRPRPAPGPSRCPRRPSGRVARQRGGSCGGAEPGGAEDRAAGDEELAVRVDAPVSMTTATVIPATASTQITASTARHGRRRSCSRRCHHNLIVVASTRPHDGTPGSLFGAAAYRLIGL